MATLADLSERLDQLHTHLPYILSDYQDLIHKHQDYNPWIADFYKGQKALLQKLMDSSLDNPKLMDTFQEIGEVFKKNHMEDEF